MHKPANSQTDVRRRFRFALAAVGSIVAVTAAACSSSESFVVIGGGTQDAGAGNSGQIIGSVDGGDAAVSSEAGTTTGMCIATECPYPFATCSTFGSLPTYVCGTNLTNDVNNCGACGNRCLSGYSYHLVAACVDAICQPACEPEYFDCNGLPDDGCEARTFADPNNCGTCGNVCPAGVNCVQGQCGCPPGQIECDGACVDPVYDDNNCGGCGIRCSENQPADADPLPPHMLYGCLEGVCKDPHCIRDSDHFWDDCNGDKSNPAGDGCEVDLKKPDMDNCGKCGRQCQATQQCFETLTEGMDCQCKGQETACTDGFGHGVCADLESDPANCGACGYQCPSVDGAAPTCSHGRCSYICRTGMADCNGRIDDGCEVDTTRDPRSCGACGIRCEFENGQPCVGGRCITKDCDAGPVQ